MSRFIDTIIGSLDEKRDYRENEKRAKTLPSEYAVAYKEIKHYIFTTSGITHFAPLKALVELLEEAAATKTPVVQITGPDVAAFADDLVRGEQTYFDQARKKLNSKISKIADK